MDRLWGVIFQADSPSYARHRAVDESVHRILEQQVCGPGFFQRHPDYLAARYPLELVINFAAEGAQNLLRNWPDHTYAKSRAT